MHITTKEDEQRLDSLNTIRREPFGKATRYIDWIKFLGFILFVIKHAGASTVQRQLSSPILCTSKVIVCISLCTFVGLASREKIHYQILLSSYPHLNVKACSIWLNKEVRSFVLKDGKTLNSKIPKQMNNAAYEIMSKNKHLRVWGFYLTFCVFFFWATEIDSLNKNGEGFRGPNHRGSYIDKPLPKSLQAHFGFLKQKRKKQNRNQRRQSNRHPIKYRGVLSMRDSSWWLW